MIVRCFDTYDPAMKWNSMSGKSSVAFAYFVLTHATPSTPPSIVNGPFPYNVY